MRPVRKTTTTVFVCDKCGTRKRLDTTKRHWCEICTREAPVEMRPSRAKRLTLLPAA